MSILSSNLDALEQNYPELVQELCAIKATGQMKDLESEIESYQLKTNLSELNLKDYSVFFCAYSIGLGEHIIKLYEQVKGELQHLCIVEKNLKFFYWSLSNFDWREIIQDERVDLFVGIPEEEINSKIVEYAVSSERLVALNIIQNIFDYKGLELAPEYYLKVADAFKDAKTFTTLGDTEDAFRGFLNVVSNLDTVQGLPDIKDFDSLLKDVPGIVVSSGPSLDQSIEILKKIQEYAFIICADSALKKLLDNGIIPNAVGCLERLTETSLLFENTPELQDTYLIASPVIHPNSFKNFKGPTIMMMRGISQMRWFFGDSYEYYHVGNSVAHLNYHVLRILSCQEIYLVGQDLSYAPDNSSTHASGALPDLVQSMYSKRKLDEEKLNREDQLWVESNNDSKIMTTKNFDFFREFFERMIRNFAIQTYNVIPKNYGAKILGSIQLDPQLFETQMLSRLRVKESLSENMRAQFSISQDKKSKSIFKSSEKFAEAISYLQLFKETALNVLNSTSLFIFDKNPMFYQDYQIYMPLLQQIEQVSQEMMIRYEKFYSEFLLPQICAVTFPLNQQMEEIFRENPEYPDILWKQLDFTNKWYNCILIWSSRLEAYLKSHLKSKTPVK